MKEIYLDSAATTKPRKEVVIAMMPYLTEDYYNPSSLYSNGVKVKNTIDNARKTVGKFINADADEIFFTSGASESNCWAIQGRILNGINEFVNTDIITTKIEHKSIMNCVDSMKHFGCNVSYLNVDHDGFIDIEQLKFAIDCCHNDVLVSIQLANNEIGSIQNIKIISKIVHEHNGILHVDATQAFGQIHIDVKDMGIDMLSASGHKIGAPKGIGVLYKKKDVDIYPLIYGSQMNGLRGGTENVPYIVGMAKAVEHINIKMEDSYTIDCKRDILINRLKDIGCKLNGPIKNRLPNNISIQLPEGVGGEEMLYLLDLDGIMVSTGSACNSHAKEPSYVLKAIGLTDDEAARTIRITVSTDIDYATINKVVDEIEKNINLIKE